MAYLAKRLNQQKLAEKYESLVMVDDCPPTGSWAPRGEGTPAQFGVIVDILTGKRFGQALGGAIWRFISQGPASR